jgi:hypothetical protein
MPLLKVNQIASYTGNTLTIGTTGDTVTLAAGSSVSGFGFDGVVWTSNIVTSNLTVSANVGYFVNTSAAAITITLPASASNGDQLVFVDYSRKFGTNNLTLNQNSVNFQGFTTPNPVYSTDGQTIQLVYADSTQGWIPISDDDVTNETPQTYSVDFLVIAGGAGGGAIGGGGGGAGGYRTSTQSVAPGTVITVTVGDGGAGGPNDVTKGTSGSNSSISGSGLSTITSAGGGGGGSEDSSFRNGVSGGSGGGGSRSTGTGGSGNTPNTSPSQGNNGTGGSDSSPYFAGGGGGGAGGVAGASLIGDGGAGGVGTSSSITGSSVQRSGGGSGGCASGGSSPVATGGGGRGAENGSSAGVSGTANTGGGGGGGGYTRPSGPGSAGGAGGKGVVILSMPLAKFSGTTTGSPTESTSGSNKILVFNGSGSYTA